MSEEQDMIKTNVDSLVTDTTLDPRISPETIVEALKRRKTTGQLVFHMSQGGIQKILLTEKTKADDDQASRIRKILGFSI
jgi:hypothetical protein